MLERKFSDLHTDQRVDVVFTIETSSPGDTICCTSIHNQKFHNDFCFPTEYGKFAFLQAVVTNMGSTVWLGCDGDTTIVPHIDPSMRKCPRVIEACAGIGAVGRGFLACGATTTVYVDNNEQYCNWLRHHKSNNVIHGDISEIFTTQQVANVIQGDHVLSGGVSCQPFSSLGDRRENMDQRSRSFPALLRMGFYLNVVAIIMECTKEVMQSVWAQSILKKFSEVTGYQISQKILHLHRFWPGFRTRWWAVVSHPTLPASDIPDMPDLSFEPGVVHVVPRMLKVEGESLKQLECDLYELRNFHSVRGGVQTCILNMLKPMPTATHSWGSQLRGCLCKCRASGFSSFRLKEHGLYGVLLPLESTVIMNSEEITMLRHLHPQEVALLCGLTPEHVPDHHAIHCRLTLFWGGPVGITVAIGVGLFEFPAEHNIQSR